MRTSDEGSRPRGVNCSCFSWYMATWRCQTGGKATEQFRLFYYSNNMKHLYFKCLLLGILSLAGIKAQAYHCCVNGIYYNLDSKTAEVTSLYFLSDDNQSAYTGSVTIPSSITYEGTSYSVTRIGDLAFEGCSSLTSMRVEQGNPVYDSRDNCNAIIKTSNNKLLSGVKQRLSPTP